MLDAIIVLLVLFIAYANIDNQSRTLFFSLSYHASKLPIVVILTSSSLELIETVRHI